jgi:sporulation protein YlmC with PRC-barrel domain
MKAGDLKNMTVVSLNDGTRLGRIEDVLFDTTSLNLAALAVNTPNGRTILPMNAVRSVGADAITVESGAATQAPAPPTTAGTVYRSLKDLSGIKLVNAEGSYLGDIKEIEIDPATRALTGLDVQRGGVLGLGATSYAVPASAIRSIGPDLVTADYSPPSHEHDH